MLYLDTCELLALLTPEVHSQTASAFLAQATDTLAISPWTATERHSALALKVRTGALSTAEADRVLEAFDGPLAPSLLSLDLDAQDFRNANACLRGWSTTLCAADALHLAIASARGATLCRLDAPFVQAAEQLGLAAALISTRLVGRKDVDGSTPPPPPLAKLNRRPVQLHDHRNHLHGGP